MERPMKFTNRKKLLQEADLELKKIIESIRKTRLLTEDSESMNIIRDFENQISKLKNIAKEYEKQISLENKENKKIMAEKKKKIKSRYANPIGKKEKKSDDDWKNEPVYSKYALKNLPPTNDPRELEKRKRMMQWERVNKKLIDSWDGYVNARMWNQNYIINSSTTPATVYRKDGTPIMSKERPGKVMTLGEYDRLEQLETKKSRAGFTGLIEDLLDSMWFWLSP